VVFCYEDPFTDSVVECPRGVVDAQEGGHGEVQCI